METEDCIDEIRGNTCQIVAILNIELSGTE